eukprot:gene20296-24760_t
MGLNRQISRGGIVRPFTIRSLESAKLSEALAAFDALQDSDTTDAPHLLTRGASQQALRASFGGVHPMTSSAKAAMRSMRMRDLSRRKLEDLTSDELQEVNMLCADIIECRLHHTAVNGVNGTDGSSSVSSSPSKKKVGGGPSTTNKTWSEKMLQLYDHQWDLDATVDYAAVRQVKLYAAVF